MTKYPALMLVGGLTLLVAAGIGTFYSLLAVGVSDGPGLVTARVMLGCCVAAVIVGVAMSLRSAAALWTRF